MIASVPEKTYPPKCTAVNQLMDQGIITATKLNYRRELLDVKVTTTMLVAGTLRAQAEEHERIAGTMELAERHHSHMLDAEDLLKFSWRNNTQKTLDRYVCIENI